MPWFLDRKKHIVDFCLRKKSSHPVFSCRLQQHERMLVLNPYCDWTLQRKTIFYFCRIHEKLPMLLKWLQNASGTSDGMQHMMSLQETKASNCRSGRCSRSFFSALCHMRLGRKLGPKNLLRYNITWQVFSAARSGSSSASWRGSGAGILSLWTVSSMSCIR